MRQKVLSRRSVRRAFALAAALAALVLPAAPASGQCRIIGGVDWVGVELMEPPSSASGLTATQRTLMRREHAHVSSTLADMLALEGLIDSDPFAPNPQVRVVIEDPNPIDGRRSFAIFTVTEIFDHPDVRIRVFAQEASGDEDSGEYKLFADRGATGGVKKTSDQLDALEDELADQGVVANVWDVQGDWGRGQTDKRLHVTAPAIYPDSFPGLRQLVAKSDYAAGIPFRFSVALHGYAHDDDKGVILGGRGVAQALVELLAYDDDQGPTGICDGLDP